MHLAIPAFAALVAEPLFLLADTGFVGYLGAEPLAGLAAASTLLATAVGLCVFLAYGTTATVGRRLGAGQPQAALQNGIDGLWLGLTLGAVVATGYVLAAPQLLAALGTPENATTPAHSYLTISCLGLPAMLLVLAATGILRGFQDTKTPLYVSVIGALSNIGANYLFIYPLGMGIAGSAWGTVLCQVGMATAFLIVIAKLTSKHHVSWRPHWRGMATAAQTGIPLVVRTLALRTALVVTTMAAAHQGHISLAAHQVTFSIWMFFVFSLDALAIAGQAITGKALGAHDTHTVRTATARMIAWGLWVGGIGGALLIAIRNPLAQLFNDNPHVINATTAALIVVGATAALSGYVFVIDGVLIGAGDGRYLAWTSVAITAAYLPIVGAVVLWAPANPSGLIWLWLAFAAGFMAIRAITLALRIRSDHWLRTGSDLP